MYAKLFSRITESSLMEESVNVRYVFIMLLAIADPEGVVIGTDVAVSRRLNIPLQEFKNCVEILSKPDANSNSAKHDGKRLIPNDGERGYLIVNYTTYRGIRDEEERRAYMREYMRRRRNGCEDEDVAPVNSGKLSKPPLAQAEAELIVHTHTTRWFPESLRTPEFERKWTDWEEHLRESSKTISSGTRRAQLSKCEQAGVLRSIEVINLALTQGWKSLVWDYQKQGHANTRTTPAPSSPNNNNANRNADYSQVGKRMGVVIRGGGQRDGARAVDAPNDAA